MNPKETTVTPNQMPPKRNFYGRRKGKALKPNQRQWIDEDLDRLALRHVTPRENPTRQPIDPDAIFGDERALWLEVGFGGGEHLVHQAQRHPEVGLIGCEPYINGVAMLLGRLRSANVRNVALHPGDVRDLFDVLPDACIARVFLLYPDPWPKARHQRRRFVTPEHLEPLARVLKPGAEFRLATDIPDYVRQAMEEVPSCDFDCLNPDPTDWHRPWEDWHSTRYEQKALREGRHPHYLTFRRR